MESCSIVRASCSASRALNPTLHIIPFSCTRFTRSVIKLRLRSRSISCLRDETALRTNVSALKLHNYSGPAFGSFGSSGQANHQFSSSVGSSQLPQPMACKPRISLSLLDVLSCMAAISASCLFISAIPTLIAFKKAAESLERLLIVTREELPATMAAVRLSGMEISDLTMELSDLGQEITEGVKKSTKAFRAAEDRFRRVTSMASIAYLQDQAKVQAKVMKPAVAKTARSLCDSISQGRNVFKSLLTLGRVSGWLKLYRHKRREWLRGLRKKNECGIN